ncbi:hypothetical protein Goari_006249, partial [Gossypium aridum]|nr:hypothetical protein [Gossypium aridum]
ENLHQIATNGKATNIVWHKSSVGKVHRQEVLQKKGCVIWITGLSGSAFPHCVASTLSLLLWSMNLGKSTLACALCQALYSRGKLAYILDGDNVRHGLNCDFSFKAEDRAENIRRIGKCCLIPHHSAFLLYPFVLSYSDGFKFQLVMVHTGEVAKLFADAGIIGIASVISPYRKDRDVCRSLLPEGDFIEVFMNVPLQICEARDPKGLYKLARAGKINGFTGIDDPYEPPLNCEVYILLE